MKNTLLKTSALALAMLGCSAAAMAQPNDEGHWLVRGRIINVTPLNNGGSVSIGGKPSVSHDTVPELDVSYFMNPNVAFELIAGTTKHDVTVKQRPSMLDLGSVRLLPPTLTAQYHFTQDCLGKWKPYVGAGLTYAHFYDANHPGYGSVKYDDRFGIALQAGTDYKVADHWYLNADVKQIMLNTKVTVNDTITAKEHLNPVIAGVGIGYRF